VTQQLITTTPANTQRGDSPKAAFDKVNANFTELYGQGSSCGAASINFTAPFPGAVTETVAAKLAQTVSVLDFGADPTGATDSAAAIQTALNSGAHAIYLPPFTYRCASGIIIPQGVTLYSTGFQPSNPPTGAILNFDLAVPVCVTMGGAGATNGSVSVRGFSITRAAGAAPAGSIGLLNQNLDSSIVEDIMSVSHQVCAEFNENPTGITCMVNRLYTAAAYDTHVVHDTQAEVRFNQCRFGMNGLGDQNCNSYIRIQGGSITNPADGPNTYAYDNCQFNQGGGANCARWVQFSNLNPGTVSDVGQFMFSNCHVEAVGTTYVASDSTWTNLGRLKFTNMHFNSVAPFLSLNAATQINDWELSNSFFAGSFTLAPTSQINFLSLANNKFNGSVAITGASNSSVTSVGNTYDGGLTLAGSFAQVQSLDVIPAVGFSDTSTSTYKFIASNSISVNVANTTPKIILNSTGAPVDQKKWQWSQGGTGNFNIQMLNDAESLTANVLNFTRTGVVLNALNFGNATNNPTYNFLGSGAVSGVGSGLTSLNASNISSGTIAAARLPAGVSPVLSGTTAAIGGSALLAGQVAQGTVTIAGATTSMVATASPSSDPDSSLSTGIAIYAFVSAANTVTVRVCAIVAVTPAAVTYNVRVIQ